MKSRINVDPDRAWFTSDLHFYHEGILEYEREYRPYRNVADMNEGMIRKWNSQVKPGDIVFCIGDFSFGNINNSMDILEALRGKVVMIWGNHDDHLRKKKFTDMLLAHSDYLRQKVPDQKNRLEIMHFPIHNWRDQRHGSIHIHGHKHGHPTGIQGKIKDVGWDTAGRLYTWREIEAEMAAKPSVNHHKD